jgi:hypothetical protein
MGFAPGLADARLKVAETALPTFFAHTPIAAGAVHGYTDDAIVQHRVLEPGLAFIQKPFSGDGLVRRIREVVAADPPPLV